MRALLLDERGRHVARVLAVELVDDLLGEDGLGAILRVLLELGVDVGAERDERVEADVLRELVVERREHALLEVAHGDRERALLGAEVLARMLRRERVLRRRLVADALADEDLVDLGERLTGAELDLDALAAAVLDVLAVDREREVDREDVALLRPDAPARAP